MQTTNLDYMTDLELKTIYMRVYKKHSYPTIALGVMAINRAKRWVKENWKTKEDQQSKTPPKNIRQKMAMAAEINNLITKEMQRRAHAKRQAEGEKSIAQTTKEIIDLSRKS